MSFWSKSTGESAATDVKQEYQVGGGSLEPIPDGSTVQAFIKEAKWATGREEDGMPRYINIQWMVEQPAELARRVVFQKLWCKDFDPNAEGTVVVNGVSVPKAEIKRDKALDMLATIDENAGGKMVASGGEPTDDTLAMALQNKVMCLSLKVWEIGGRSGNWIAAVSPKGKELKVGSAQEPQNAPLDDLADDIPF